jgi:ankyrin repeat protein
MLKFLNRFRWVFCQLETLRQCLPPSVRRTLDEIPESLDETYERVLREIKRPNRDHAYRLLQCLVVAIRPLEVKELAEVLAVDFDDAEGIAKLKPNWRWEDEEQALLTSCSSLITTVKTEDSRVVQFSHFSVKEYLTSERLATSSGNVSRYHIDLEPAHTILAQACLSVLLQPDDGVEDSENVVGKSSPLAGYAAEHWVTHARFERVASFLRKAMEYLFSPDMPYFAAWLQLYDIDTHCEWPFNGHEYGESGATPLYYAALCGLQDLVEHLVVKNPQHVNTRGGKYGRPLVAALAGRHLQTASHLLHNGAHVDVRDNYGCTPLNDAVLYGDLEMVQILLDYKAEVNARTTRNETPIHRVSRGSRSGIHHHCDIARLLLERGADLNAEDEDGETPLHVAAQGKAVGVVRVLLEHGANVGAEDNRGRAPLHGAAENGMVEVVRVLLEHGANVGVEDNQKGRTPLHRAVESGWVEVVRVLLEHGANVGAKDSKGKTPLHRAAEYGMVEVVRVLLEHGANVCAEDNQGRTPLHRAAALYDGVEIVRVLLEHGANIGAEDNQGTTPLHRAAAVYGSVEVVRVLLEHGANVCAEDNQGRTPLHDAEGYGSVEVVRVLLEHGANVGAEDNQG